MNQNRLGIIGGMGPEATVDFYSRIVKHTSAYEDQDHLDMIIFNHASIIDRTLALKNGLEPELLDILQEDLNMMESLNVTNIAIPCNTCHVLYNKIQNLTTIPIINMIEETVKHIVDNKKNYKKIGLMATDGTVLSGMYQEWFDKYNLVLHAPQKDVQAQIMDIIYHDVKSKGIYDNKKFEKVLTYFLQNGCTHVILGCTELSGFKEKFKSYSIDPMDYLVKASIERTGGIYKED